MKVVIEADDDFHKLTVKDVNQQSDAMEVLFVERSLDCEFYIKPYKGRAGRVHTIERAAMVQFCEQYLAMERSVTTLSNFYRQWDPETPNVLGAAPP